MFEDLDKQLKGDSSADDLKKAGVNEFIISHNKDFSIKKEKPLSGGDEDELGKRVNDLEKRGRKRGLRYSIIGILGAIVIAVVLTIIGYFIFSQTSDMSDQLDEQIDNIPDIRKEMENRIILRNSWLKCEGDNDCIETKKDCCECHSGGDQAAINRRYFNEWYELLANNCQDIACPEVENCVDGRVWCNNNVCEFLSVDEDDNLGDENYYELMDDRCLGDVCCLSSLDHMREQEFLECDQDNECPEDMICIFNDCEISLGWCEFCR